ncbi:hypothetical protein [Jannaschia marina]|uniref:hypothetical protein n=1 Tax=Jannaschia marina TaxID=2741674 RepID=UPI0015CE3E2F|nr:hypothetical protein [Jannaschia marina]
MSGATEERGVVRLVPVFAVCVLLGATILALPLVLAVGTFGVAPVVTLVALSCAAGLALARGPGAARLRAVLGGAACGAGASLVAVILMLGGS